MGFEVAVGWDADRDESTIDVTRRRARFRAMGGRIGLAVIALALIGGAMWGPVGAAGTFAFLGTPLGVGLMGTWGLCFMGKNITLGVLAGSFMLAGGILYGWEGLAGGAALSAVAYVAGSLLYSFGSFESVRDSFDPRSCGGECSVRFNDTVT